MYGGAFDPPHLSHTALAQAAIAQYQLDRLHIIPTGQAWHKSRALSSASHRIAMARLAFADLPQAFIDERETQRSGATYTIDTLRELQTEYPGARLFLLMGQDQWLSFPSWKAAADIASIATLLVAFRAGKTTASYQCDVEKSAKIKSQNCPHPFRMQPIEMSASALSSSEIRARAAREQTIEHLVKSQVARYIADHHLYLSNPA